MLYRSPSERSLHALEKLRSDLGPLTKLRSWLASWQFRVMVWPRFSRVLLLLSLPTAVILLYHGTMGLKNPVWSVLSALSRHFGSPDQRLATVKFLSEVYPSQSRDEFLKHFKARTDSTLDDEQAGYARGLVNILDHAAMADAPEVRAELVASVPDFAVLLKDSASGRFTLALGVLRVMSDAAEGVVAPGFKEELLRSAFRRKTK